MPMAEGVDDGSTRTLGSQQWEMREAMCTRFCEVPKFQRAIRGPQWHWKPRSTDPQIPRFSAISRLARRVIHRITISTELSVRGGQYRLGISEFEPQIPDSMTFCWNRCIQFNGDTSSPLSSPLTLTSARLTWRFEARATRRGGGWDWITIPTIPGSPDSESAAPHLHCHLTG